MHRHKNTRRMDEEGTMLKSQQNRADQLRIKHLRLLELIDEHKSLAAVAAVLHLSQPTVTGMVQTLESVFGVTLVNRSFGICGVGHGRH